jgi:transcriptional regulator GlxA family with amidase domain
VTVNKEVIDIVEKRFPEVKWVRDERWVVDGKFWTAGGAVVGMDMAYAFLKGDKFNLDGIPEEALAIIEYTARPQSYA